MDVNYIGAQSILKIKLLSGVHVYLGISQSIDNMAFLFGMKISSVKFLFPMVILGPVNQLEATRKEEQRENLLEIFGLYIGFSLGLMLWNHRREKQQIDAWRTTKLPGLQMNY